MRQEKRSVATLASFVDWTECLSSRRNIELWKVRLGKEISHMRSALKRVNLMSVLHTLNSAHVGLLPQGNPFGIFDRSRVPSTGLKVLHCNCAFHFVSWQLVQIVVGL
jgi:hypothetical protein